MSDLVAFLSARLEDDLGSAEVYRTMIGAESDVAKRIEREVEARQKIINRYLFARNQVTVGAINEAAGYGPADAGWPLRADSHELDIRALAAVYSDHPDYRQEWAGA